MKNDRIIEFSLHMKVRNWSRPPSPPSQCWKLKCCQTHKFDHQHKIQHWSEGGRGSKSSRKLSHLCIFGAAWSAKVCRVILPKLAGSDFELSHTIFKCWQTHEIHQKRYAFLTIFWQFTGIEWGRWRRCTEWDRLKRCTLLEGEFTRQTYADVFRRMHTYWCIQRIAPFGGSKNRLRMGELRDWPGQSVRFWGK